MNPFLTGADRRLDRPVRRRSLVAEQRRLTVNLGSPVRPDDHEVRQQARCTTSDVARSDHGPDSTVLREPAVDGEHLRLQDRSPRLGRDLCADGGREDGHAGRVWQLLHCRSSIEYLRRFGPDAPELTRVFQMFEVGPWSDVDTNGDG